MRVYILNTPEVLQPAKQGLKYPSHNKDYSVEQDFLLWLKNHPELFTDNPHEADWHYLPVYWTRWHINHDFAQNGCGLNELQQAVNNIIIDDSKTFTIAAFDGGSLINMGKTIEFTGSRTNNTGIDMPIICSPHRKPPIRLKKKYIASFNGSFSTHPIRVAIKDKYQGSNDILVAGNVPTRFYKRWFWAKEFNINTMRSYVALCPRGTSCNSYRFFEAMQLGTAPCLIGDNDVRPFKKFIPWDDFSYYAADADELDEILCKLNKTAAIKKGEKAYWYWKNELNYQKWCKYVLMELEDMKR